MLFPQKEMITKAILLQDHIIDVIIRLQSVILKMNL